MGEINKKDTKWKADISEIIIENPNDAIIGLDSKNMIIQASKPAAEFVNCSREELIGKNLSDYVSGKDVEKFQSLVDMAEMEKYNFASLEFKGRMVEADMERDEQGNYKGAVVRLKPRSLIKKFLGKHRPVGIGTKFPEYRFIELFGYVRYALVGFKIEITNEKTDDVLMKKILKKLVNLFAGHKNKLEIILDISKTKLDKDASDLFYRFYSTVKSGYSGHLNTHLQPSKEIKEKIRELDELFKRPYDEMIDKLTENVFNEKKAFYPELKFFFEKALNKPYHQMQKLKEKIKEGKIKESEIQGIISETRYNCVKSVFNGVIPFIVRSLNPYETRISEASGEIHFNYDDYEGLVELIEDPLVWEQFNDKQKQNALEQLFKKSLKRYLSRGYIPEETNIKKLIPIAGKECYIEGLEFRKPEGVQEFGGYADWINEIEKKALKAHGLSKRKYCVAPITRIKEKNKIKTIPPILMVVKYAS